jgi:hypothetical protein
MSSLKAPTGSLVGISRAELINALQCSVGLQSHYAELLNMHDAGERMKFETVEQWIGRLRQVGK